MLGNRKTKDLEEYCKKIEAELDEYRRKDPGIKRSTSDILFRNFMDAGHPMVISNLRTGAILDANHAFLNLLGYSSEEIDGKTPAEINLFADPDQQEKYIKLAQKLNKIKDYSITVRNREGKEIKLIFSSEIINYGTESLLLSTYEINPDEDKLRIGNTRGDILDDIFNTITTTYLGLFTRDPAGEIIIVDLNQRACSIESVTRGEVVGKKLKDTPLSRQTRLVELIQHMVANHGPLKVPVSPANDDSEGTYVGFIIRSGSYVITWEPGIHQKNEALFISQNEQFERLADMLPEMIYEVDNQGKITYANERIVRFFGYSPEDLEKGVYISQVFPDDYKKMIENLRALNSPDDISTNEYYARKKDGSTIPVVTHSFPTFYDGRIISYRGTITDISRQKEYEEQISTEKAFLEHLIDSTPEAIAITDKAGLTTMVNKEFTNLFGYSAEEALNRNIDDLIVPNELKTEASQIETKLLEKEKIVKQTVRKHKSGSNIQVALVATGIIANDEIVALLGIYRDISSERKNELLQEILYNISSAALKQMDIKEIYPTIVHELSKIWDTNNFFIALYDKESDTMSLPFFADEKDNFQEIPTHKTISGYVIKTNKPVLLKVDDLRRLEELGIIDLVGTDCKVWMGVPLKVEGNILGIMCLQDYNDENKFSPDDLNVLDFIANQIAIAIQRRIMLDNLVAARQKAEEAAESKQIFMSTMSHEIRTPLNEVIGITNLLLQGNPRDDQMDYIKTLRFSGNHLLTLVNDVLDYNKMESGKIIFEQIQFNMNDFLDEIMRSYSFRSKAKHLDFEIRKEQNVPSIVVGDQIRLNQILSNLLSNALKFTNHGGISVNIRELSRKDSFSTIEFSVMDTGIGIPKEKHGAIFESFTQASTDTTRNYGGTGLGLAICKKLIELQGGKISVESEQDKGSKFTFYLKFQAADKAISAAENDVQESFTGLEGKRILVAEDNKINFFVANKFLQGWGVIVTHAENGKIAVEKVNSEKFDLILMDLHMPVMDGIEATKVIRESENKEIRNLPIVALTAAIMSESHDKIDELNINDYVLKPFKPHDLFSRILKHVR